MAEFSFICHTLTLIREEILWIPLAAVNDLNLVNSKWIHRRFSEIYNRFSSKTGGPQELQGGTDMYCKE